MEELCGQCRRMGQLGLGSEPAVRESGPRPVALQGVKRIESNCRSLSPKRPKRAVWLWRLLDLLANDLASLHHGHGRRRNETTVFGHALHGVEVELRIHALERFTHLCPDLLRLGTASQFHGKVPGSESA